MSNLFWGNHLRCLWIKLHSIDSQVLFRLFHPQTTQSTTAITSIVIRLANQLRIKCESAIFRHCEGEIADSHEAIQKNNNPCDSTPNLARFVVQKIGFKDAVVPSADFLLESEKRGSPPKSEKRQLLARRGSGVGGAALLRKENCDKRIKDSKADLSAESHYKIVYKVNFSKVPIQ